jgi:acetyl esterase/lipase
MGAFTVQRAKAGKVPLLILQPKNKPEKAPTILWIHGGGYATGMAALVLYSRALPLVKKYGAVCASAEKSGSGGKSRCVPYRFPCF